jgi:hypothetical protein
MTLNLFDRVARFEPILPLTFGDDEWVGYAKDKYQNVRNSAVFKEGKNGRPYYINAYSMIALFPDGHKSGWSGKIELVGNKYVGKCYIKDPANMPMVNIEIPVRYVGKNTGDWEFKPIPEDRLVELKKYYDVEIKEV